MKNKRKTRTGKLGPKVKVETSAKAKYYEELFKGGK